MKKIVSILIISMIFSIGLVYAEEIEIIEEQLETVGNQIFTTKEFFKAINI